MATARGRIERGVGHWGFPLGLAVAHLLLSLAALHPEPYIGGDNGSYVSLARALLEHGVYVELWDPARPPHTQYPPVFPAALAVGMALGLRPWMGLALVGVAFSAVAVGLSVLWLRRATTPGVALGSGGLLALMPGILQQNHWILSDVPAWTFTALALWAFARFDSAAISAGTIVEASAETPAERLAEGGGAGGTRWLVVGAVAATLSYLTRSAGLPLVVAALLWLALRRRWRAVGVTLAVFLPPSVLWWLRGRAAGAPGYVGQLLSVDPYQPARGAIGPLDLLERVGENGGKYLTDHLPVMLFGGRSGGLLLLGGAVLLLALAGWARRARAAGLAETWVLLYAGLILVWPATWSGERFLVPLVPALLLYAGEALRDLGARVGAGRAVGAVAAAALLLAMLPGTAGAARAGAACRAEARAGNAYPCMDPMWSDLYALADGLRGRLPEGSVVISRKPTLFFAISGYPSRMYPMSQEPDSFFRAARAAGAEFVVVDQVPDMAPLYLHPVLLARRDDFCVVPELSLPNATLVRIDTAGPPRDPGAPPNAFRSCPLAAGR